MGYGNTEVFLTAQEREGLISSFLGKTVDVAEPMKAFRGRIIAAICRADDNEDKLVAAPEGMTFTAEEIREATWFVEQYFDSTVRMAP